MTALTHSDKFKTDESSVLPFFSFPVLMDDSNATSNSKMKRAILAPSLNVKFSDEHQLYSTMEDCVGKS